MPDDLHFVLTDTSTAHALDLQRRLLAAETDEERSAIQVEINAILRQWSEAIQQFAAAIWERLAPIFQHMAQAIIDWWESLQPKQPKPRRSRGYWKRRHREEKQARAALAVRYRAKR